MRLFVLAAFRFTCKTTQILLIHLQLYRSSVTLVYEPISEVQHTYDDLTYFVGVPHKNKRAGCYSLEMGEYFEIIAISYRRFNIRFTGRRYAERGIATASCHSSARPSVCDVEVLWIVITYRVAKQARYCTLSISSLNIDRFSQFFTSRLSKKYYSNTVIYYIATQWHAHHTYYVATLPYKLTKMWTTCDSLLFLCHPVGLNTLSARIAGGVEPP